MSDKLFMSHDQDLSKIHDELMEFFKKSTTITFDPVDGMYVSIPENGYENFWFDDLVEAVLVRAANSNKEIVDICLKKGIGLYDISISTKKKQPC